MHITVHEEKEGKNECEDMQEIETSLIYFTRKVFFM